MKAQSKKQAKAKVKEMMKTLSKAVEKEVDRLLDSQALPFQNYENTFELPKTVLSVALENLSYQYSPFSKELKKIANNLKHF